MRLSRVLIVSVIPCRWFQIVRWDGGNYGSLAHLWTILGLVFGCGGGGCSKKGKRSPTPKMFFNNTWGTTSKITNQQCLNWVWPCGWFFDEHQPHQIVKKIIIWPYISETVANNFNISTAKILLKSTYLRYVPQRMTRWKNSFWYLVLAHFFPL